jgi:hypothetical protein
VAGVGRAVVVEVQHRSLSPLLTPLKHQSAVAGATRAVRASSFAAPLPSGTFEASLRMCSADLSECHDRVYNLPEQPTWASTCDTLGDVQHSFDKGVSVGRMWYWVSAGDQNGAGVELTLYPEQYCGGNPVEFNTSFQGRFRATQDPSRGDPGWLLPRPQRVMSVRDRRRSIQQGLPTAPGCQARCVSPMRYGSRPAHFGRVHVRWQRAP